MIEITTNQNIIFVKIILTVLLVELLESLLRNATPSDFIQPISRNARLWKSRKLFEGMKI